MRSRTPTTTRALASSRKASDGHQSAAPSATQWKCVVAQLPGSTPTTISLHPSESTVWSMKSSGCQIQAHSCSTTPTHSWARSGYNNWSNDAVTCSTTSMMSTLCLMQPMYRWCLDRAGASQWVYPTSKLLIWSLQVSWWQEWLHISLGRQAKIWLLVLAQLTARLAKIRFYLLHRLSLPRIQLSRLRRMKATSIWMRGILSTRCHNLVSEELARMSWSSPFSKSSHPYEMSQVTISTIVRRTRTSLWIWIRSSSLTVSNPHHRSKRIS